MTKNEAIQKALRLEEKVIDLQMHLRLSRDCTAELRAEIAQLTAERNRYKVALELVAAESFEHFGSDHVLALNQIAINALSQEAK